MSILHTHIAPCPFCGKQARATYDTLTCRYVECENIKGWCGTRGPERTTEKKAILAWNRRAKVQPQNDWTNKTVHIKWKDPAHDWNWFKVISESTTTFTLQGIDDPETNIKHEGDKFIIPKSDIKEIVGIVTYNEQLNRKEKRK